MLKTILTVLVLLLFSISGLGQKRNDTVTVTRVRGSHKVKLVFSAQNFDVKRHTVKTVTDPRSPLPGTWIDGKFALGTDLGIPRTEIASVRLYFDGKQVPINRSAFSDCYNPNLGKDYIWLKLGDDGKSVLAFMAGGDGAGGYQVFWIFRNDGKHSRFSSAVSDADYSGFVKWFFEK